MPALRLQQLQPPKFAIVTTGSALNPAVLMRKGREGVARGHEERAGKDETQACERTRTFLDAKNKSEVCRKVAEDMVDSKEATKSPTGTRACKITQPQEEMDLTYSKCKNESYTLQIQLPSECSRRKAMEFVHQRALAFRKNIEQEFLKT